MMENTPAALPLAPAGRAPLALTPAALPRWFAAIQVLLVCGIPTQLVVAVVLVFQFGMPLMVDGGMSLEFFALLSLIDTALIALLIRFFLATSGESSADVFLGRRPIAGEVVRGLIFVPFTFLAVTGIVLGLRAVAPWTHTVDHSPVEAFMRTPFEAAIFLVVAVLAGGVREELQRAFILRRFSQRLGGINVGLTIFTITFGALHLDQGIDAAVAVGALGLFWGILYIRRGSAVAAMVNHAGFDAAQILQSVIVRSFGG
jgi:membrane protease YdiL (CAAX protease family)